MNRLARLVTVVATLSLPLLLSDCSSFDPSDIMDSMFASQVSGTSFCVESTGINARPC